MITSIARILDPVLAPALAELASSLRAAAKLSAGDRAALHTAATRSLREVAWQHVCRVVVLELHVAGRCGRLTAADSQTRWQDWADHLSGEAGWDELATTYPALPPRLNALVRNRCAATLRLARRYGDDRAAVGGLAGGGLGTLTDVEFGAGDSHSGGESTTILHGGDGRVVYKPRSLEVDATLGALLPRLLPGEPVATRIRVPDVLARRDADGDYGWAQYVAHRHCRDHAELCAFYRGLGHWLAVLRLLSGSDLHAENLIAAGPVPTVVDCETLFTPSPPITSSGYGQAADRARQLLNRSVLAIGMLPGRAAGPGLRGLDLSGAGALPGQQPVLQVPGLVDQGTDRMRMATVRLRPAGGLNLPSPEPDLVQYWQHVEDGYLVLTEHLRQLDSDGHLEPWLAEFADCPIRSVRRDTAGYLEIGHMLWHPSSLHQPQPAAQRAAELLATHARNVAGAPDAPAVIAAEVAELLDGDIPMFTTTARSGVLAGPRGTRWGEPQDLVAAAVSRWRSADPAADCRLIRSAVVSAYLDDNPARQWQPPLVAHSRFSGGDVDLRRRALAAGIIGQLAQEAIRGEDGTATWTAPAFGTTGWAVRPIPCDMYSGLLGVAVAVAGYRLEMLAGRADPVQDVEWLLASTLATVRLAEDRSWAELSRAEAAGIPIHPEPPGAYTGLGSRIWGWLLLHRLGAVTQAEAVERACRSAGRIAASVAADETHDLLAGAAGAIVPLLALSAHGDRDRWLAVARSCAGRLRATAAVDCTGARWPTGLRPQGLGGLAHGAAGIGWALARLAAASPDGNEAAPGHGTA
ncbi:type 2 lanthipeptide synthetase LanM family protein, partial [Rhizocola hellebori]|uniref:type 2 lanthipeptide synthetase LanM family protein n=1 Tax=Rhizocola hellebori TaxID=1392758 RepID=UPI00194468CE